MKLQKILDYEKIYHAPGLVVNIVRMAILPISIYRFNAIHFKFHFDIVFHRLREKT